MGGGYNDNLANIKRKVDRDLLKDIIKTSKKLKFTMLLSFNQPDFIEPQPPVSKLDRIVRV